MTPSLFFVKNLFSSLNNAMISDRILEQTGPRRAILDWMWRREGQLLRWGAAAAVAAAAALGRVFYYLNFPIPYY